VEEVSVDMPMPDRGSLMLFPRSGRSMRVNRGYGPALAAASRRRWGLRRWDPRACFVRAAERLGRPLDDLAPRHRAGGPSPARGWTSQRPRVNKAVRTRDVHERVTRTGRRGHAASGRIGHCRAPAPARHQVPIRWPRRNVSRRYGRMVATAGPSDGPRPIDVPGRRFGVTAGTSKSAHWCWCRTASVRGSDVTPSGVRGASTIMMSRVKHGPASTRMHRQKLAGGVPSRGVLPAAARPRGLMARPWTRCVPGRDERDWSPRQTLRESRQKRSVC